MHRPKTHPGASRLQVRFNLLLLTISRGCQSGANQFAGFWQARGKQRQDALWERSKLTRIKNKTRTL